MVVIGKANPVSGVSTLSELTSLDDRQGPRGSLLL
jgi:hypothetical protein